MESGTARCAPGGVGAGLRDPSRHGAGAHGPEAEAGVPPRGRGVVRAPRRGRAGVDPRGVLTGPQYSGRGAARGPDDRGASPCPDRPGCRERWPRPWRRVTRRRSQTTGGISVSGGRAPTSAAPQWTQPGPACRGLRGPGGWHPAPGRARRGGRACARSLSTRPGRPPSSSGLYPMAVPGWRPRGRRALPELGLSAAGSTRAASSSGPRGGGGTTPR